MKNTLSEINRLRHIIRDNGIIPPHVRDINNVDLVADPHLKLYAFLYGVSSLVLGGRHILLNSFLAKNLKMILPEVHIRDVRAKGRKT